MKNYTTTIVLVLLVILASLFVFKDNNKLKQLSKNISNTDVTSTGQPEQSIESGLTLELSSPKDKVVVNTAVVTVTGKTSPGADVFVNEKELKADSTGNFSVDYELFEGENNIFVAVNDILGNYAEKTVTVYLETTE